jgi:putative transposase
MPSDENPSRNHSRGYLPHVVKSGALYFVTFRLADSLPQAVLREFENEINSLKPKTKPRAAPNQPLPPFDRDREKRKRIEAYLDRGAGASWLSDKHIARVACEALLFFNGQRYELDEWVIMPNHIHALVRPINGCTLSRVLQTWKWRIASEANKSLGKTGERFWQPESFDRVIRDDEEKLAVRRYIRRNPVKAGLCASEADWPWSSASNLWKK